jgi:hypothetical protein
MICRRHEVSNTLYCFRRDLRPGGLDRNRSLIGPASIYLQMPAIRLSLSVLLQYLPQSLPPALAQAGRHFSYEHPQESAEAGDMPTTFDAIRVPKIATAIEIRNIYNSISI